jgi:hypothetical protein
MPSSRLPLCFIATSYREPLAPSSQPWPANPTQVDAEALGAESFKALQDTSHRHA